MKFTVKSLFAAAFAVLLAYAGSAAAVNYFSRAGGGNWGTNATWSTVACNGAAAGASPAAADNVTICTGDTVTMNGNPGAANSLTITGTATWGAARTTNVGASGVTVNAGGNIAGAVAGVLTSTGGLTINAVTTSTTVTVTLQTTAAQTISGTGSLANLTINATATNTGSLTVTTALAGTSTLTNTGTLLNIGGTSAITGLTANTAANTVNYTGVAQTVKQPTASTYSTLGLSGSGAKTMTGITTITGNLNVSGTATMTGNAAFTLTGALNYSSTGSTTLTAATAISIGTYNQTAGTLVDNGNTITVTGTGASTWAKTGTFTATGTAIFTGAAPQIGASNFNNLTINVGAGNTATLTGSATPAGNLSVTTGTLDLSTFTANRTAAGGTLTVSNGATLKIGGTNTFPTNYTTHTLGATSTVEYSGGSQSVAAEGAPGYGHLILSGGGGAVKTAAAGFTVRGNLTIASATTFAGTTFAITVNGNVSNSGTHTATTGTITLSGGAGAHALSGTGTYANLVLNDANGATLSASPTVSGVLTFTSGVISTGANTMITSANCPGSVSRTSGHVSGNLQLNFATGAQTCTFHVGDSAVANYTPVAVTFTNVSVSGGLIGTTAGADYSDPGTLINTSKSVNRNWTLSTPGSGALSFTGSYSTVFTYLSTDNDAGTTPAQYVVEKGDTCTPNCTWTLPTISGTPTNTSATATGMTSIGVLAIGEHLATNFLVSAPASPVNTCTAQAISITARDAANNTVTQYTGSVNISTSTGHGDWSVNAANGTLTNSGTAGSGTTDDGLATYQFVAADKGSIVLNLTSNHADSLTITVTDSVTVTTTGTSSALQYNGASFAITNDTIQVAKKDQSMTVAMNGSGSCTNPLAGYNGPQSLKVWLTLDGSDPGGTKPTIGALTLPTAVPGANNLALTFTNGSATFILGTTDVGKYVLNLRDDSRSFATNVDINGSSPSITTRPFTLAVSGIKQGATNNPGTSSATGTVFAKAGTSFELTLGAYRYSAAADSNNDGVPDATATFAQTFAGGLAPSFAATANFSAVAPFTPAAGGVLNNGSFAVAAGSANPTNLNFTEVGSFSLSTSNIVTSYLGTIGVNLNATVFNSAGTQVTATPVVGRFTPNHFTLSGGVLTNRQAAACAPASSFSYMSEGMRAQFTLTATNALGSTTANYTGAFARLDLTTATQLNFGAMGTPPSGPAANLTARTTAVPPAGTFVAGAASLDVTVTVDRAASPDGPFTSARVGVAPSDPDGVALLAAALNMDVDGAGGNDHQQVGANTELRFGRLRLQNASGPLNIDLPIPIQTQYWNGSFVTNSDDNCTSLSTANFSLPLPSYTGGITATNMSVTHITLTGTSPWSLGSLKLTKPSPPATTPGATTLTVNLSAEGKTYLQGAWTGTTYTEDPSARASFGVFGSQPRNFIFFRENY